MTPFAYLSIVAALAAAGFAVVYLCERREQRRWDRWDRYCAARWVRLQCIDRAVNEWRDVFADADNPIELLGLLAGAASVCWEDVGQAGVFQSQEASDLVDAAVERLIELGWS